MRAATVNRREAAIGVREEGTKKEKEARIGEKNRKERDT